MISFSLREIRTVSQLKMFRPWILFVILMGVLVASNGVSVNVHRVAKSDEYDEEKTPTDPVSRLDRKTAAREFYESRSREYMERLSKRPKWNIGHPRLQRDRIRRMKKQRGSDRFGKF